MYTKITDDDAAFLVDRCHKLAHYWWIRLGMHYNESDFVDTGFRALMQALEKIESGYPFENSDHFRAYCTLNLRRNIARTLKTYDNWLHIRKRGWRPSVREKHHVVSNTSIRSQHWFSESVNLKIALGLDDH